MVKLSLKGKSFPAGFVQFCSTAYPIPENQNTFYFSNIGNDAHTPDVSCECPDIERNLTNIAHFKESLFTDIIDNNRPNLVIDKQLLPNMVLFEKPLPVKYVEKNYGKNEPMLPYPHIDTIRITNNNNIVPWFFIKNMYIRLIIIDDSFEGEVTFENCWIVSLQIKEHTSTPNVDINISNTYVGTLNMSTNSCSNLNISGGGIRCFSVPNATENGAITNSLNISGTTLLYPQELGDISMDYRNLLTSIKEKANIKTQQHIQAAILYCEKYTDNYFIKLTNFCYRIFSRYNTRPELLLFWIIFSLAWIWLAAFLFDQAVTIDPMKNQFYSNSYKSLVLSINSLYSPLAKLDTGVHIISKTIIFSIITITARILNIIWATLLIICIKKRFAFKTFDLKMMD